MDLKVLYNLSSICHSGLFLPTTFYTQTQIFLHLLLTLFLTKPCLLLSVLSSRCSLHRTHSYLTTSVLPTCQSTQVLHSVWSVFWIFLQGPCTLSTLLIVKPDQVRKPKPPLTSGIILAPWATHRNLHPHICTWLQVIQDKTDIGHTLQILVEGMITAHHEYLQIIYM